MSGKKRVAGKEGMMMKARVLTKKTASGERTSGRHDDHSLVV